MNSVKRYILLAWCVLTAVLGMVRADDGFNPDLPPEPMQQTMVSISATPADATSSITLGGSFNVGKHITVSVTPKSDYTFLYWTLNGEQYTTERSFDYEVGSQSVELVAVLSLKPQLTVSVTPSGAGSAYGSGRYEVGSSVFIQTYANNGYTFLYWMLNDEQYSTEASFYYTMGDEDVAFVAVYEGSEPEPEEPPFDPEEPSEPMVYYRVDVTTNLPDGVKPTNLTPSGSYAPGRNVTLVTNTPTDYVFLYWTLNDVLYSEQTSCPYVVGDSDVVFTACFAKKRTITLRVSPEEAGSVSGAGIYAPNTKVLVSTTPRDGYAFLYWMRGDEVYAETLAFYYIVNAVDVEFVAVYEQIVTPPDTPEDPVNPDDPDEPFNPSNPPEPETDKVALNITVAVNDAELGYVAGLPETPLFAGDVITLTAVPNNPEQYYFLHWADGNTANPREITLSVDARFVAVFAKQQYTVTFYDEDSLTILDQRQWGYGDLPTCVSPAKPSDEEFSYRFAGWTPELVTVTGDAAYYATYEALPLELPLDVTSMHYDAPAIKHIISGQLIIRRAGNSFTVLGTAIQ